MPQEPYTTTAVGLESPNIVITYPDTTTETWQTNSLDIPRKNSRGSTVDQRDGKGNASEWGFVNDYRDGTAQLIIDATGKALPTAPYRDGTDKLCTFPDPDNGAEKFVVTTVSEPYSAGSFQAVDITFRAETH